MCLIMLVNPHPILDGAAIAAGPGFGKSIPANAPAKPTTDSGGRDQLQAHLGGAGPDHLDLAGGAQRDVDHALADERAAVVDPDDDAPAVGDVGDPKLGAERQGAVGGGEAVRIEALAARG